MVEVWDLVSWLLWLSAVSGVGALLAGVALSALGRAERGRQLLAGGLAAVLVSAFGWGLVTALYPTPPTADYSWALYALAGATVAIAGVYLALGRFEEGARGLVAGLLIVGVGALAGALATGLYQGAVGALTVNLHPSTTALQSGQELTLGVAVYGTSNPVRLNVSWGDGSYLTDTVEPGRLHTYSHTYRVPEKEAVATYSITVEAVDTQNPGVWGRNAVAITVQNQGYCPLGWPWSALCGLYRLVSYVLPAVDLQKLVTCPTLPTSEGDPVYGVYQLVLQASMGSLGLFLAFAVVWSAVSRESPLALPEALRDAVLAVALALLAPYAYNATAHLLNLVSYQLIEHIDVGWVLAWIMLQVGLGVVLGYFVPFVAHYAAFLAVTLFLASVAVYVRYVLILALATASPLLAVAYLHPALRGAVRHAVGLLAGLMLSGPLAAVFLVVLNAVVPGRDVVFGMLFPLIVGVLPTVLGALGGAGIVGHVAGGVVGGVRQLGGAIASALRGPSGGAGAPAGAAVAGVAVAAGAPTTVARLRLPAFAVALPTPTRTHVESSVVAQPAAPATTATPTMVATPTRPAPIVSPAKVREAVARAREVGREAELLRRDLELHAGLAELARAEREAERVAREAVPEELLRSKAIPEPLRPAYEELVARAREEAYAKAYEELEPPKPAVHPRWEAFKTGVRTLAKQMGRQAWVNLRALATETKEALKYQLREQIGIDLDRAAERTSVTKWWSRRRSLNE